MWKRPENAGGSVADQLAAAGARIAQLEAELRASEERDPVTGLATLNRFRAQLETEAGRARRHGRELAIAVLDIDGFRAANAAHGHAAGDAVLRGVGELVHSHSRAHDFASRTGGDEFEILMPETGLEGATAWCERMLLELEALRAGPVEGIRISAGVAALEREESAAAMVGHAHAALDRSRRDGGGRVTTGPAADDPLEAGRRDAVSALAVALLERDRYTGEHSESVVDLVATVGRGLGLSDEHIDQVKAAALMHDIGKVAIPDEILNKPAELSDTEWKIMRDHTKVGERILRAIPGMGGVARIVRSEHERWDGTGYPDGLAGEAIPVGARMILACDAYHAMTSDRPYRKALGHAAAMDELVKHAGTQFDPAVVEVLVGTLYGSRQSGLAAPA
ncbi:MAG: bifunctional diguanylate cyclase/phosphohydrolase [Solirubrobacteraceae bacterium]